jgi:ribosomal protein L3
MAGHMGTQKVTVTGLTVVAIDPETNTILIKGLVPGGTNGLLFVSKEPPQKKAS